jgi:hypothetical protein
MALKASDKTNHRGAEVAEIDKVGGACELCASVVKNFDLRY